MKVHIILNSHLDPVWLWRRSQGVDEVLGTARTACDLLDLYPEIKITRGEAWFYETIEECDPALFERVKKHVAAGRWEIVGGWYIQPDCNLTGRAAFMKHNELGRKYFESRFDLRVKTGYNVDSFGHAVTLPDFYAANQVENYIMMRPGEHEMHLPGNDFIWQSPNGNQVRVFRISCSYCTSGQQTEVKITGNLENAIRDATPGLGHTMCFIGVGNHGGGPAKCEIDWLLAHRHYRDDIELVFSTPSRYFAEVAASQLEFPVVKTELQHHAIGCYTAVSRIKREVKATETLLSSMDNVIARFPSLVDEKMKNSTDAMWKKLLFATFHDVLPGSSIASAYPEIYEDLGGARTMARQVIELAIRRQNVQLPPFPAQRLIFDNPSDTDFSGFVEFEPWLGYIWADPELAPPAVRIAELDGSPLPSQISTPEAGMPMVRLTAPLTIPAGGRRIIAIHTDGSVPVSGSAAATENTLRNAALTAQMSSTGIASLSGVDGTVYARDIRAEVIDDPSDTWSHNLNGYAIRPLYLFKASRPWTVRRNGPLSAEVAAKFSGEDGTLRGNVRIYENEEALELRFKLDWHGCQRLVKLVIPPGFAPVSRLDGTPGGEVVRALNGEEYPVADFVSITAKNGQSLAVISRDISGADVQPDGTIRLTLLRSPYYAHHDPFVPPVDNDYPVTDQGEHEYRIRLLPQKKFNLAGIRFEAAKLLEPVFFSETTMGCGHDLRDRS